MSSRSSRPAASAVRSRRLALDSACADIARAACRIRQRRGLAPPLQIVIALTVDGARVTAWRFFDLVGEATTRRR